jgi:hypothetical protein
METKVDRTALGASEVGTAPTVVFVGHARLPESLAHSGSSPVLSVELETDRVSGEIVSVGCGAIPDLGAKLLAAVLIGRNINESPIALAEEIRHRYVCPSQKAMSTALLNAFETYQRYACRLA